MKNNFFLEGVLAVGVIFSLFLLANPWNWFMSDMIAMTILCVAALLFLWFISFVFAENTVDEREELHRYIATRLGYYGGASVLMGLIIIQKFQHNLDASLVYALGAMLFMKVVGMVYAKIKY